MPGPVLIKRLQDTRCCLRPGDLAVYRTDEVPAGNIVGEHGAGDLETVPSIFLLLFSLFAARGLGPCGGQQRGPGWRFRPEVSRSPESVSTEGGTALRQDGADLASQMAFVL